MTTLDYYNDFDPFVCSWLDNLAVCGDIPFGYVDRRSINDVEPRDLDGYRRVHFFAGIGGWAHALELACWPTDRPVWTGSCPCQPFSAAGKRKGVEDERHLWPRFRDIIAECRPATIFGEQVASKDGRDWLATVRTDLEALGYAVGCADLCDAGVGAPHIRQRLYWVADAESGKQRGLWESREGNGPFELPTGGHDRNGRGLGDTDGPGSQKRVGVGGVQRKARCSPAGQTPQLSGGGLGDTDGVRQNSIGEIPKGTGVDPAGSPWGGVEYIPCRDGKARPVVPGVRLLAHGFPNRVGLLRGFGNAIVPQVAAEFIRAFLESEVAQ